MDNIQFLDVTGLNKDEICRVNSHLFDGSRKKSFPWTFKKNANATKKNQLENSSTVECNGTSKVHSNTTSNLAYAPQVAYIGIHYNQNQLRPMVPYVHHQHPPMYTNYHHPAQIMSNADGVHYMISHNQMYNYAQIPVTYQNHPHAQYYSVPHQEVHFYNGVSNELPVYDNQTQIVPEEHTAMNGVHTSNDTSCEVKTEPVTKPEETVDKKVPPVQNSEKVNGSQGEIDKIEHVGMKQNKVFPNDNQNEKPVKPISKKNSAPNDIKKSMATKNKATSISPAVNKKDDVNSEKDKCEPVKENGVKTESIPPPVNVWTKKPWVSLFKNDTPKINGDLVKRDVETPSVKGTNDAYEKPKVTKYIHPRTYRLGEFLQNYKINTKTTNLQPRGLINKSNYCYINSILQALVACPPLCNLLKVLGEEITDVDQRIPMIESMCKFITEFSPLPCTEENGTLRSNKRKKKNRRSFEINCGDSFEATSFYTMLNGTRSDSFLVEGRQEDAEEFLGLLLNGLNDEMMNILKVTQKEDSPKQEMVQDSDDWKVMGPKNKGNIMRKVHVDKTPISEIFGGLLCSKIHKTGDETTVNIQPFFTLQLNIEKADTITEALEQLTVKNQLEGLTSSKTKKKVDAWQQVMIEQLPVVLVLHLKCFDYKLDGCTKIMKTVEFPIDLQIDSKILSGKSSLSEKKYRLFAVVYHEGKEAIKGHYIADVFHSSYSMWLRYDDSKIKRIDENSVLNPQGYRVPYLLFYGRTD